jgi:AAA15 family ATPase/GTPase
VESWRRRNKMKSEIRDSEINELLEKVSKRNYGSYLISIDIKNLRGFEDKQINFEFPVTALIGPNGGGKTTILGAAGILIKDIKPRRFFAKYGVLDTSMTGWKAEYKIIEKTEDKTNVLTKTASYGGLKWSRNSIERPCAIFGIARTVPPSEKIEFTKYSQNSKNVESLQAKILETNVANEVGAIIGKDVSHYSEISIDTRGLVKLLSGETKNGVKYSEFHFGAGESSIIRMIIEIESLPENSLVLIEEIENGLHPVATRRMVEYLIKVALRKKIQTIFTTHSNEALIPLPAKAIWVASEGKLYQGKLDINSLRAITGRIEKNLAIFCEDRFSKEWIESVIRTNEFDKYELIEVHGLEGDGIAVNVNKHHKLDPTNNVPSICFIDGDSRQTVSDEMKIFRLLGQGPESYIYDKVRDKISEAKAKLAVKLNLSIEKQDFVEKIVKEVRLTNRDEHLLFSQLGEKAGFISETIVRNAFLSLWNELYIDESNNIYQIISREIPDFTKDLTDG